MNRFRKVLNQHSIIALDTCIFIYHLEENKKYLPFTEWLLENLLPNGKINATCSALALTEILIRPTREKRLDLVLSYKALMIGFPHLTLISINPQVADQAAYIRSAYNLKTPDSIHLASAYVSGATLMIGNDRKWKNVKEIKVIALDDYA
ncbi:hypothetical protein A2W14_03270 [Candidatus Gottesmanbacteria bacterium RBG_16_37_8]|uniref:PIN domain-containing protein n=1 Tax=Candidatus Gottesmanbacteria bacterium RBG_16_37_8 TaxID=1798371 RepID=A0A1F5YUK6_9BACT|nr:MAG: hypothetical protein A2W14_03270 [Candidatus Gottesmanbacteria bacterium RBG_16_37_8]